MKESTVESYLREEVKKIGGKAYKFVSPGNTGVPDRLVVLPGGRTIFFEMKAPGKKPTPLQNLKQNELTRMGCTVYTADSKEAVYSILVFEVRKQKDNEEFTAFVRKLIAKEAEQ